MEIRKYPHFEVLRVAAKCDKCGSDITPSEDCYADGARCYHERCKPTQGEIKTIILRDDLSVKSEM